MSDFELVDELSQIANVKVPNAIEEIRTAPVLHDTVVDVPDMPAAVKNVSWKFENIKILLKCKKKTYKKIHC